MEQGFFLISLKFIYYSIRIGSEVYFTLFYFSFQTFDFSLF